MKKLLLIGPDGTKTYIDLGDDFSFNEDDLKKYLKMFFEHLDEDELDMMLVDADSETGHAKQVIVPNIERFLEMLEFKKMTKQYISDEDIEIFFETGDNTILN